MQPQQTGAMSKGLNRKSDLIQLAAAIRKESRELCEEIAFKLKKLRAGVERSRLNLKEKAIGAWRPTASNQRQPAASAASTSGKI